VGIALYLRGELGELAEARVAELLDQLNLKLNLYRCVTSENRCAAGVLA